jgi:hypothetical protein
MSDIGNLEKLMMDTKECLERELHSFRDERVSRLDPPAGRCQTLLWETGRRWSYGMDTWAAKIESALETKDRQIADLARRIDEPNGTEHLPMTSGR